MGLGRVSPPLRRGCKGGEFGGERPGVPESGLSQFGGDPGLLRGEEVPEGYWSESGVFLGDGERVKTSAEEDESTESWLRLSPPFLLRGWKLMVPVIGWPR